jgi:hypothetical protein
LFNMQAPYNHTLANHHALGHNNNLVYNSYFHQNNAPSTLPQLHSHSPQPQAHFPGQYQYPPSHIGNGQFLYPQGIDPPKWG